MFCLMKFIKKDELEYTDPDDLILTHPSGVIRNWPTRQEADKYRENLNFRADILEIPTY